MTVQPYLMTRAEWETAVSLCRQEIQGNNVQTRATRGCMTSVLSASQRLTWLHFGVRDHLMAQVEALRQGKVVSNFASKLLVARLESPVRYCDVRNRARRLGLI